MLKYRLLLLLGLTYVAMAEIPLNALLEPTPTARRFDNCAALLVVYPRGVAKTQIAAAGTGAVVDSALYAANGTRLDRDRDGVMCEQQASRSSSPPARSDRDRERRRSAQGRLGG